ncbi:MAG: hypothetical protein U1F56_18240 [Rubrivivax sp.]
MRQRSPFFWAALAGLAVLLAAFAPVGWQMWRGGAVPAGGGAAAAPWAIERVAAGEVRAFGLRLPGATLADARRLWGAELQLAVIASRERPAALEAYVERWSGGGLDGRLVLAADADPAALQRWQQHSPRRERIEAQAERWALQPEDAEEALRRPVRGLSFLPAARVDAAALEARFGVPPERISTADGLQHWIYPERGLAVAWQAERGRAVVQVAAPADVEARLRAPLRSAAAAPGSGPTR